MRLALRRLKILNAKDFGKQGVVDRSLFCRERRKGVFEMNSKRQMETMEYDVVALGELLIDFAAQSIDEQGYPYMKANPGGAPGNFLAALTKYGAKTAMIGKVGNDSFGKLLINTFADARIETKGIISSDDVFTTLAFVSFDENGDRSFSFARKPGADVCIAKEEIDFSIIDKSAIFHFGTLSLTDEPARTATQAAVEYAKQQGKQITFDPNLRLPLWKDENEAKQQMLWGLSKADIVKISDNEVEFLWGINEVEAGKKLLEEYAVKLAMITLGPKGCYLVNKTACVYVECPKVNTIDTTGAGDIFGGSALSRILLAKKDAEELTQGELCQIAQFATAAASLSTQTRGAIPSIPPIQEVEKTVQNVYLQK